jgi:hypothetical protein
MTATEYHQRYLDFQTAIGQTRIVALGAAIALDDFPKGLPGNLPTELKNVLVDFAKALTEAVEAAAARGESVAVKPRLDALAAHHRPLGENAVRTIVTYWLSKSTSGLSNPPKPDFHPVIYAQELVMHLAHLDGFLADSLRAMCAVRPELLCRERKVSWEEVVKAGSYETLLRLLVEEYVYECGWRSVRDKISYLESAHGLIIPAEASLLANIDQAEAIRHLVVHNASRVSREYIKRSGKGDEQLGTLVSIQSDFAGKIAASVQTLAAAVFEAVTAKYLGGPSGP